ncbi:Muniscin C-terminal mu homology domain-containing protein [Hyaloraphidium curvatum]|nr:Muniscin C-terminal mu homology domain-containing protein [Hyaloraphidium curvatum]
MNNYVNAETEAYRKAMSVPDKVLVNVVSAEVSAEIEDFCAKAGVQSGGSPVAESTSRGGPSLPQFSGFGFKGLNRASSILSIGQKFNETLTWARFVLRVHSPAHMWCHSSKTHHREAEQPGTRTFDSQPSPPATFSTRDQITVDEEGYRVVVHSDPFANPVNRNFEDDDDDEEGSPAPQQRIKVEIKEQAISDGAEDMAAVLSSMAEKMGVAGGGVSKRPGPGRPSASSAPDVAQTPDSPRDNASAPSQGDWPETSFADEVLQQFPPRTVQQLKLKMFVTETVNAVVDASGQISKMLIVGEVGLALGETLDPRSIAEGARFELSLADRGKIEKIVPNGSFCASYGDGDSKSFMCDLKAVAEYGPTEASALPLLKYQVSTPDSELDKIAPLIVRSRWKPEASQTSLLLLYQFNPSDASMASAVLKGVDVLVSVAGTAEVTNVQCKPSGPWNKDRRMLLWRLGDLVASAEEPGKLIARFETAATPGAPADGPGADPSVRLPPGPITVRFSCDGVLLSGADIVAGVGDRPGLESVEVVEVKRQVVAGKYVLMP